MYLTIYIVMQSANVSEDKGLEPGPAKDEDPDGRNLLQAADPLERAANFLGPLETQSQDSILVWVTVYDVAVRRSRYLASLFYIVSKRISREVSPSCTGSEPSTIHKCSGS